MKKTSRVQKSLPKFIPLFLGISLVLGTTVQASQPNLLNPEEQKIHDAGRISGGRISGGTLCGALIGFGCGQAITHQYASYGWIFTAIDALSVVGMATFATRAERKKHEGEWGGLGEGLTAFGFLLVLGGSHIAQAITVPVVSAAKNANYDRVEEKLKSAQPLSINIAPLVLNDGGGLSLGVRF